MKKTDISSITYNPYRHEAIEYGIVMLIGTVLTACVLPHSQFDIIIVAVFVIFVILDVVSACLILRDPRFATSATIDCDGVHICFKEKDTPLFVPWSSDVYINICIEDEYVYYNQFARRRVLCLSNKDINGEFVRYDSSINLSHQLPNDSNEQWILFLVTATARTCKKAAKHVSTFRDSALS